jgi:hypothetical protein
MFDSLNRNMLSAYGCSWTKTPDFKGLAEKRKEDQPQPNIDNYSIEQRMIELMIKLM